MLNLVVDIIYLRQLEYGIERADIPDDYNCFEIGYCGHPALPYAHIQLEQSSKLIISHLRKMTIHSFMISSATKIHNWFAYIYFYRPNKNAYITDLTNNDKKLMHLCQHMEMGPLIFTIIWYQMLCFTTQTNFKVCWWIMQLHKWVALMIICMLHHVQKMGVNSITTFLLNISQCITFNQTKFVIATLIAKARLKSLYLRLGFKVIKDF